MNLQGFWIASAETLNRKGNRNCEDTKQLHWIKKGLECENMGSDFKMTVQEFEAFEKQVKNVFDIVRVLDENLLNQVVVDCDNHILSTEPCECFSFWKKNQRCENCISAKVLMEKSQRTKLEILDGKIYQVFSKYAEIDGKPCAIEMLSLMEDDAIVDSHGRDELIKMLSDFKKELYTDALTGCYNRRYYEECLRDKDFPAGVAMLDMDNFKGINDTFGHDAGDLALKQFVEIVLKIIRKTDMLVRLGGDEFMVVLLSVTPEDFKNKLEVIRQEVEKARVLGYRKLHMSISAGGILIGSGENVEKGIRRADEELYKAKKIKNTVLVDEKLYPETN